jgi:hypothetical protein
MCLAAGAFGQGKTVKAVSLKPVACTCVGPDQESHPKHGNIVVTYADGTSVQVSKTGLSMMPKLADDRKTVGWVEGMHQNYPNKSKPAVNGRQPLTKQYFPAKVIVFRDGKVLHAFSPTKIYTLAWQFVKGGSQVATATQGSHGPTYGQLFDVQTGKKISEQMLIDEKVPAWAKGLEP